jgi:hypothetical protein
VDDFIELRKSPLKRGFCAIDYAVIMIMEDVATCALVFNALRRSNHAVFTCNYIAIITLL